MSLIQLVLISFALFAITRVIAQFKKGGLTLAWLLFWIVCWVGIGTIVLLPQTTDVIARIVGVGRGADLITYLSIVGLFFLVFKMFAKIETVEQEITRFIRVLAIKEAQRDEESTSHKAS